MKKSAITIFMFLAVLFASYTFRADALGSTKSVGGIISEILKSQNIGEVKNVDCEKIDDSRFEELGDAVMGLMHPDEKQHKLMDQMMGGEGSEELRAAHIIMGRNYLGCLSGLLSSFGMMGPMMGSGGMMGNWPISMMQLEDNNKLNFNSMMGFGSMPFGWVGLFFMVLFWALVILGVIALMKWLAGNSSGQGQVKSASDILKERYAKGEINKAEFEEKKKDLGL